MEVCSRSRGAHGGSSQTQNPGDQLQLSIEGSIVLFSSEGGNK